MKKIFLDTNILIDLIADRKPHSKFTIELFERAESQKLKLYTSSHSLATTYYLLRKHVDDKRLRHILLELLEFVIIIPIDIYIIKRGLKSKHKDFEDALQIMAAVSIDKMDCIITRDLKDFRYSEIPVFSPDEILKKI